MDHSVDARHPLRLAAQLLAVALLIPLTLGLVGGAVGAGGWARDQLPLTFRPTPAAPADMAALWLHNLSAVTLPLLGAAALSALGCSAGTWRTVRALLDALLAVGGAGNLLILAVSVAGYGPLRLARWLPHLPFEFAALAIGATAYLVARRVPLRPVELTAAAAAAVVLLGVAALLETYGVPHR